LNFKSVGFTPTFHWNTISPTLFELWQTNGATFSFSCNLNIVRKSNWISHWDRTWFLWMSDWGL